jgi:hypothetical protein
MMSIGMRKIAGRQSSRRPRSHVSVPTEKDWGDYQADLDTKYAHDLFAGRTNQEMQVHFRRNPIERADELRWMPPVPFRYYVLGFRDFVIARDFDFLSASDAASCFLGLVLEKLEKQANDIIPVMRELLPALEYIAENQGQFEADKSIYGDFRERLKQIKDLSVTHGG